MIAWIQTNWGLVFAVLFAVDQILAAIPSFESNSVFQFITGLIASAAPKTTTAAAAPAVKTPTP